MLTLLKLVWIVIALIYHCNVANLDLKVYAAEI